MDIGTDGASRDASTDAMPRDAERSGDGPTEMDAGPGSQGGDSGADGHAGPDATMCTGPLCIEQIVPDHGPFVGGNHVSLRGAGFSAGQVAVRIGGRILQTNDESGDAVQVVNDGELRIRMPAGYPGSTPVEVTVDGARVELESGYVYDPLHAVPEKERVDGGTLLRIHGARDFGSGDRIFVGGLPCPRVRLASAREIHCRLPPGEPGAAALRVVSADDSETVVEDAFEYKQGAIHEYGGAGGPWLDGELEVLVRDAWTREPLEDARILVQSEPHTPPIEAQAGADGRAVLRSSSLEGEVDVHVIASCYRNASWISFERSELVVSLLPWEQSSCPSRSPPASASPRGSLVQGALRWPGGAPWQSVPEPDEGQMRVAHVRTTRRCATCSRRDPTTSLAEPRVDAAGDGSYSVFTRPGYQAVYALAGIEDVQDGSFTPYVMGVARDVVTVSGRRLRNVDIPMNVPLDRTVQVELDPLPGPVQNRPGRFEANLVMHLGAEGAVVPVIDETHVLSRRTRTEPVLHFDRQPQLRGPLEGARYDVRVKWRATDRAGWTASRLRRIGLPGDASRHTFALPAPARAVEPADGEPIPADRILRWRTEGASPTIQIVSVRPHWMGPSWWFHVPGDRSRLRLPDVSTVQGVDDPVSGGLTWRIHAFQSISFVYAAMTDRYLNEGRYRGLSSSPRWRAE
jgi:hypothetical protein